VSEATDAVSRLVAPHGGRLNERLLTGDAAVALAERAEGLPRVALDAKRTTDLELLAVGAYSPLDGFMTKAEHESVVATARLPGGLAWGVPLALPVDAERAAGLQDREICLTTPEGAPLAVMAVAEAFEYDRAHEAEQVFGTEDGAHPGVAALYEQGDILLGGSVQAFALPPDPEFPERRLTPAQTRTEFARRGWSTVVGFQTRNPVHRAHEYLQKVALEMVDGLLLHPLVGETKEGDVPADVRMRCYEVLLAVYYPRDRVVLSVLPAWMRYAGPREAIFHAIMRQNYGCSHFIVGRDHAGVGDYYGTFDAQLIFDQFTSDELAITPLKFEHAFYCTDCGSMASIRTCPHGSSAHVFFSGTKVREMLAAGEAPPAEFTRPEVAAVLIESMRGGG
jgi:sulfate adenylyltransferase